MSIQLFDRIRAFLKSAGVYKHENLLQNQGDLNRAVQNGELISFSSAGLLDQTNLQINRMERYKDYDQMDEMGEISLALDLYADESTQTDPETKHSIAIRAKSNDVKEELEKLFYDGLNIDNKLRPMVRYICKYGDFAAEIIPNEDRTEVASYRPFNIFSFLRVETKFGDLVGFFFTDEMMDEPIFLHPWQVMHLRLTSYENIYAPYGRCCDIHSRISTPSGYKYIKDLGTGDEVYAFDNNYNIIKTKVVAQCLSGEKETLKIKTKHFENICSHNHPVLVRQWVKRSFKFGEKWFTDLVYKRADELKIGDELIIPRIESKIESKQLIAENNGKIELNIPQFVDEQFAKLFGFMIGDGWLLRNKEKLKGIAFALGEHEKINSKYEHIIESYGINTSRCANKNSPSNLEYQQLLAYSIDFANLFKSLGFKNGAKIKRLPEWIYDSPKIIQEALIEGLVDADGSINADKWNCDRYQIELANEELIKDIKTLLHIIGWKCGNVCHRFRKDILIPHEQDKYHDMESWYLYFYKSDLFDTKGRRKDWGPKSRLEETKKFGNDVIFEPIMSIEDGGIRETADIQVEHRASNFIANGMVVHNSILDGARKDFRRLRLMEDAALIYRITRAPEKRIFTIPVGNIPTNQIQQYLNQIADQFKKQRFYDPASGEVNWRYAPLIQEDDFWMPQRPDGTGPSIDTLPGAENLDQIADIEYFKKKMVAPLKIPFSRVGIGDDSGGNADKSLASSHTDFAKAVQYVQQEICVGLKKIALVHLALKGFDSSDMSSFDITMTSSSAIDELYRIETWNSRAGVIATLRETKLFTDDWILSRFTDMTEDEIEKLKEEKLLEAEHGAAESEDDMGMDMGMGGEEMGGELGGMLPGLEEYDKTQAKVIAEYKKATEKRNDKITKSKERYNDSFNYLLNENEFDGLPLTQTQKDSVIVDGTEHDPFILVEETEENKNKPKEYIIKPLIEDNEEAKRAYAANRELLGHLEIKEDIEEMNYAIMKISDGVNE